jgi:hypothetical protein
MRKDIIETSQVVLNPCRTVYIYIVELVLVLNMHELLIVDGR